MPRREHLGGPSERLFVDEQAGLFEESYQEQLEEERNHPVECLGMTFPNDEERRKYFVDILREKLKDPEFRKIEGFPIGSDEDILTLSDPPYYTACPNPFLGDFIRHYGKPYDPNLSYSREPFAVDVDESRNSPIVNAHSYATKVPPEAVLRYVLYYTSPGDVVLDTYCGTGMTAVASQMAACPPLSLRHELEQEWKTNGWNPPEWGPRNAVVQDLSPAATFIASNMTGKDDLDSFAERAEGIARELETEYAWMYRTRHTDGSMVDFDVTLWSDVFVCEECSQRIIYWDAAVDSDASKVLAVFECPNCGAEVGKRGLRHSVQTRFDPYIGISLQLPEQVPVLIVYYVNGRKLYKRPDTEDLELFEKTRLVAADQFPVVKMMHRGEKWGDTWRSGVHSGITHLHQFFTQRNLVSLAHAWRLAESNRLKFMLTALMYKSSTLCGPLMSNYFAELSGLPRGGWVGKERSGTLFRPSIASEVPVAQQVRTRMNSVKARARCHDGLAISTRSASSTSLPNSSVDYVFIDPPFGANRYYSELNFMWEGWLRVFTDQRPEAVESPAQGKDRGVYQRLMAQGFAECYRVLKPGRWMTVEFSNTSAAIWNAIQTAIGEAGFVVADVRSLSKGQGSINAYVTPTAVKQDLVISSYKPNAGLEERFKLEAGTPEGVWDFIRTHLRQLPVFSSKENQAQVVAERQSYLLFDRMVAFHIQRGVTVPLSAAELYAGLEQRFPARDGMYFLSDQVAEYDKKRMTVREVLQLQFFVSDESSAIQWLRQQLLKKPQTAGELNPQFMQVMRESGGWQKTEKLLELDELLDQNFLRYDGRGEVPSQIHSYLSTNFKELRNLPKDDETLRVKGKDRWYVPDPNKAGDLEKLREKALLKEFEEYRTSAQKRLKVFRLEAVRAGFKKAWQERDYGTIIAVASRIPEDVLQEDPKLLMWYDQAVTRAGEQ
jgi:DNA modification methylase